MQLKITCAALAASALLALPTNAATVVNGGFEDTTGLSLNGSGWGIFNNIPGWTGSNNIEVQSNNTLGTIDAHSGDHYAELDTNGNNGMYQSIAMDIGEYVLSFFYSPRVNESPTTQNDMTFGIAGLVTGSVLGAPNIPVAHGVWTEITSYFKVETAGNYSLSFYASGQQGGACGDCGALIDDITISAVPIPAAGFLLLGALGGLGALRRRKKS